MTPKKVTESLIFGSRWLLIPFYLCLVIALLVYEWVYIKEIGEMLHNAGGLNKESAMLTILEIVDMVMVANLVKMIITGSYNSFVSKTHGYVNENISSGMLKVKMATSLIGVSSIHLLQSFIGAEKVIWETLYKQGAIHLTFLIGAMILMWIEYMHCKCEELETRTEANEEKQKHENNDHSTAIHK